MPAEKDYTTYSFRVTAIVIVMMLGLSFIPPFTIGNLRFKRTNIISDLITIGKDTLSADEFDDSADRPFLEEIERREAELKEAGVLSGARHLKPKETNEQSWNIGVAPAEELKAEAGHVVNGEKITAIEDYSNREGASIYDFCRLLGTVTKNRTVRIAFLGDSYIEGDIITADVRDQLQSLYGGKGVGFVPFSTPLASNRPTIKHTYGGWTNYSLIKKKSAPQSLTDKFFVSGNISIPDSSGAWVLYETTAYRKNVARPSSLRLIFESPGECDLKLTVNDSLERKFAPAPDAQVQQIKVDGASIKKVRVDVENPSGFIGYGVVFESPTGVGVDNYSTRSNSGAALFGAGAKVNSQIGKMLGYDLIVMQYGLNAMSADITNYANYRNNMVRVIEYIKRSFPNAVVLLMGVGDRSTMENGEFVTMPAVYSMIKEQRAMAKECGVAFWDTFTAMGGENSMVGFVEKGWAAKDYTHLSFGGGKYIAKQFVNALLYEKQKVEGAGHRDNTSALASGQAPDKAVHNISGTPVPVKKDSAERNRTVRPADGQAATQTVTPAVPAATAPVTAGQASGTHTPTGTAQPALPKAEPAASPLDSTSPASAVSANAADGNGVASPKETGRKVGKAGRRSQGLPANDTVDQPAPEHRKGAAKGSDAKVEGTTKKMNGDD